MKSIKEELISIFGSKNVLDDPDILASYVKEQSIVQGIKPWFVVKPSNAEQVHELVKWANNTKTPLVPVSSKGSHYRGGSTPTVPQAVIVDMSDMKKILNINRQQRVCVVEPGVTYGELQEELAKEGLTLSTSLAPRATKSVLADVLDIEPRLNSVHQWNFIDPLRCTEVIWGDGNRMYTGEAAISTPDLKTQWDAEKWQISGTGPMMLDFYRLLTGSQGSMGIVTWASLKCEVATQLHKLYFVPAEKSEALIDFAYRVIKLRFSNEFMIMSGTQLAYLMGETTEQVKELIEELPAWVALVGIAGRELLPEERVVAQEKDIAAIAQQFGLKMVSSLSSLNGDKVLRKILKPCAEKYWKETYKGAFEDIFFATTLDRTSQFIEKMHSLAKAAGYPVQDVGVYLQPQNMGTSYHCEFSLPYNPNNQKEVARVKELFTKASEEFSGMGAYYYRPHGIWSRLQLNKDAQSSGLLRKIKAIFDPNGIMNPGKLS